MEAPLKALEQFPGVTIGAVNGYVCFCACRSVRVAVWAGSQHHILARFAFTGGFELALGCDILVASTDAVFADTHCKFGIHPSWGLSQKLPRIIGPSRARLVSFTGRRIDAATAGKWGLVASVVKPAELLTEAVQVCSRVWPSLRCSPTKGRAMCHVACADRHRDCWQSQQAYGQAQGRVP